MLAAAPVAVMTAARDNGPTRREFDRLEARVENLDRELSDLSRGGSRASAVAVEKMTGELHAIKQEVNGIKMTLRNSNRLLVGVGSALLAGLITLLTALGTNALG